MIPILHSSKTQETDLIWEEKQIEKAKANSKDFGPLYEKYYKKIYFYINKKLNNVEVSEDLASLVFEKAMRNLTKFQWQGISLSSWLYRIARNAINDYLRKSKTSKVENGNETAMEQAVDKENPENNIESVIKDELQEEVLLAISKFPEKDQYLVYYKFFEGMSNIKIAEALDLTETNVGTRLNRLKAKLKKLFAKQKAL